MQRYLRGLQQGYYGGFHKSASDGYAGWAQLCADYQKEHGKKDFLPDIKEIIHDAKCSVYVMGALEETDTEEEGMGWAMFYNDFFETGDCRYDPEYNTYPHYDDHPSWDGLVDFRDWLQDRSPSGDMGWDIHRFNIMMREGVAVLTDPWAHVNPQCSGATSLTRKFNNSLGITA